MLVLLLLGFRSLAIRATVTSFLLRQKKPEPLSHFRIVSRHWCNTWASMTKHLTVTTSAMLVRPTSA